MSKKDVDKPDFYKKMLEAKKRKKEALERIQLHAEFIAHPERYTDPLTQQPIVVKSEIEQNLDRAFMALQTKLRKEHPTEQDIAFQEEAELQKLREEAFNKLERGL